MSNPQWSIAWTGGLGWSFYPYGDVYSLTPKWHEWHSVTGKVILPEEEENRYELVASKDADNVWFSILVGDFTDPDNPVIPDTTPVFKSQIVLPYGFGETREFQVDHVVDDITAEWTGEVIVTVPKTVRQWIGPDRVADFVIDWWPTGAADQFSRFAYGTLVVR